MKENIILLTACRVSGIMSEDFGKEGYMLKLKKFIENFSRKELICLIIGVTVVTSAVAFDATETAEGRDLTEVPHVVMAGDNELAVVGSSMEAEQVIEEIKAEYGGGNESAATFVNPALKVKVKELSPAEKYPEILEVDEAVDRILMINGGKNPLFKVVVNSSLLRKETVNYDTEYVKTKSMYEGRTEVATEGSNGIRVVTGSATYINGKIVSSEVYKSEIIKKPVNKVVKVGTKKKIVKGVATNNMIWPFPSSYNIVSGYGYRIGPIYGSEFHMGYDIAGSYGASVVAADGGTVVTAGYHPSYGYQVVIDHGNGLQTRYAHNSSLNVTVGQKVSRGQVISFCGSTGASTGNHLHFEVLKNGSHTDPAPYL